jgi:aldehyde:ferredoxin oxidoreductase
MFGSNLEIDDIDAIAEMDRLCDDYGLDTIETGSALAIAAEAELMNFGDAEKAIGLIKEMGQGTLLGRILGQGAVTAARVLGVSRVAAVKGQALPAHEPRVLKCTGFTLATSPMGADHTAGMVFDAGIPKDKVAELSKQAQILCSIVDSTGCCQIAFGVPGTAIPLIRKMLNAMHGLELTEDDVVKIGRNVLEEEVKFNRAAGITESHNKLPEFFLKEPLPPTGYVFDIVEKDDA